jgi:4-amino-4-deoxy-L-arabinose transferase-like glycosyltransferase
MKINRYLNKGLIVLFSIIALAFFLRVYSLDKIPASINPDEAALCYTSFSLLHMGVDEHGVFLPLSLQSFGDWKLPGYSYVSMIPVALFGLNIFSVRIVSALAGVAAVILSYFICLKLFKRKDISIIAALFFAISPWSIYFSRAAYEVNLATTFFMTGLLLFLEFSEKQNRKNALVILSGIFFGLTVFTYFSFIIFTPLFVLGLGYLYREKIKFNKGLMLSLFIIIVMSFLSFYSSVFTSSNKTSTLLVFNDPNTIYNRADKIKSDQAGNKFVEKNIYSKYSAGVYQFGQNYLSAFSPSFLFDKGGDKLVDNLGYFGNLYLIDALFILFGFAGLMLQKEKSLKLILLWLILAPISAALTKNPQSSTRLFLLMPVLLMISAYGAWQLFEFLKNKSIMNYIFKLALLVLFIYNVALFMDGYFVHLNPQRARFWRYGYQQSVELSQKYPDYKIMMRGPENFPYIYFLFFNKYDSNKFIQGVNYYPPTSEGFVFVKSFGRYYFPQSIGNQLSPKTIYIDDNYTKYSDKIYLPSGEPILSYYINN